MWKTRKKVVQKVKKKEKGHKARRAADQAGLDSRIFLLFIFLNFLLFSLPGVALGRPGDAWWGLADLPQFPSVNPDTRPPLFCPPAPPHLLFFVDAAHLFILNPVIIVPLHWPAGKAPRSSWRVN